MIRLFNFLAHYFGYTLVRTDYFLAARSELIKLNVSVQKSGYLCDLIRRKPKIVRRIDQQTTQALVLLNAAQTKYIEE